MNSGSAGGDAALDGSWWVEEEERETIGKKQQEKTKSAIFICPWATPLHSQFEMSKKRRRRRKKKEILEFASFIGDQDSLSENWQSKKETNSNK